MAQHQNSTRTSRPQSPLTLAPIVEMPKIPAYNPVVREVSSLTDAQLSTLCDAYYQDGIDPRNCSLIHRQNIVVLEERGMIKFAEVREVWRVTGLGQVIVRLCGDQSGQCTPSPIQRGKLLTFRALGAR